VLCESVLREKFVVEGEMGISVSYGNISMTYHLFHILETCAREKQIRAECMPKVVEMEIFDRRDS